ncbi:MAG: metallophosphoesterase [Dysgonamonadaceae bacterium]|jgi:predicted MPP superfamily phosphohydrolase|nr:metallophosphoesterase [Dysgonamonadaceae bacterium]
MMIFFILVFLIHTLVNAYLFFRGRAALPRVRFAKAIYASVYFVFYSSFIIAMLGRNVLPMGWQKIFYFIGTVWLAAMLYLTLYFLATDLIYGLSRFFRFAPRMLPFRRIQVVSGYLIVLAVLLFGYHRFTHPALVEKEIVISKSGGKYRDLKVVALSDMHLGVAIDKKRLQQYVQLVNRQHPDLILIAGDLIDNNVLPLRKEEMQEEINRLEAPLGVYFCLGNHEYLSGIEAGMEFLRKTDMTLLIDSVACVENSFWIIGRNDREGGSRQPLSRLVAQTDSSQPLFLLDHQPFHPEEAEANGIDLQFSGHTHNGQLWPLNLLVDKVYALGYGYRQTADTHLYVSSGLGLWGPPFRVGTQSELVVFNIHFK